MQKAKWLSEEALQRAVKKREVKSKGEKETSSHLNAEFQRKAKINKKGFRSDQCKEIEENNKMGKTRDLVKKIRDTKGKFQNCSLQKMCKEGRRGGKNTQKNCTKKIFTTQIIMMV